MVGEEGWNRLVSRQEDKCRPGDWKRPDSRVVPDRVTHGPRAAVRVKSVIVRPGSDTSTTVRERCTYGDKDPMCDEGHRRMLDHAHREPVSNFGLGCVHCSANESLSIDLPSPESDWKSLSGYADLTMNQNEMIQSLGRRSRNYSECWTCWSVSRAPLRSGVLDVQRDPRTEPRASTRKSSPLSRAPCRRKARRGLSRLRRSAGRPRKALLAGTLSRRRLPRRGLPAKPDLVS